MIELLKLEYHTNLHHSQTALPGGRASRRLSTILIYIILKHIATTYSSLSA